MHETEAKPKHWVHYIALDSTMPERHATQPLLFWYSPLGLFAFLSSSSPFVLTHDRGKTQEQMLTGETMQSLVLNRLLGPWKESESGSV